MTDKGRSRQFISRTWFRRFERRSLTIAVRRLFGDFVPQFVAFERSHLSKILRKGALSLAILALAMPTMNDAVIVKRYSPHRYRLTVEVDTPSGRRSASSLIEVRLHAEGPINIDNPGSIVKETRGQGGAVELPNGQTLFALMRSDDSADWSANVLQSCLSRTMTIVART